MYASAELGAATNTAHPYKANLAVLITENTAPPGSVTNMHASARLWLA